MNVVQSPIRAASGGICKVLKLIELVYRFRPSRDHRCQMKLMFLSCRIVLFCIHSYYYYIAGLTFVSHLPRRSVTRDDAECVGYGLAILFDHGSAFGSVKLSHTYDECIK